MSARDNLQSIFDADRQSREAEGAFIAEPPEVLAPVLSAAVKEAGGLDDEDERIGRLRRLADLAAQVPSPKAVDILLEILDSDEPVVRTEAGEALLDFAYRRFKDVATAVEAALDAGADGPGMQELPFVLAEVRDPDPLALIVRFLAHPDAAVVAAALEALAHFGDPAAIPAIEPLLEDERETQLPDLDDAPVKLAEVAEAALEELSG